MNADGSGRVEITPNVSGPPFYDAHVQPTSVAWSPDGDKIAISNGDGCAPNHSPGQLILVNTDGSNPTQVVCRWPHIPAGTFKGAGATGVSWHPNGQKLAVSGPVDASCNGPNVWTVNRDGTDMFDVTFGDSGPETDPDWAPDGSKLVFEESGYCGNGTPLSTINPDGSQKTAITAPPSPSGDSSPVWSPDGSLIVFSRGPNLWTVRPDGTGATNLTSSTGVQGVPTSWLAIPNNAYARPRGATPTRVSLVTAYNQCTSPDGTHGPPLAFPSCSSPTEELEPADGRHRRRQRQARPERGLPHAERAGRRTRRRRRLRRDARLLPRRRVHERARRLHRQPARPPLVADHRPAQHAGSHAA